jgi:hypothetical protein
VDVRRRVKYEIQTYHEYGECQAYLWQDLYLDDRSSLKSRFPRAFFWFAPEVLELYPSLLPLFEDELSNVPQRNDNWRD